MTRAKRTERHPLTDLKAPENREGRTLVLLPEALGTMVETNVQYRAPAMFRAQVRLIGRREQTVCESLEEAIVWRDKVVAALTGDGYVDTSLPGRTTLAAACAWAIARIEAIPKDKRDPNDKNLLSKWRWWMDCSPFRTWPLTSIHDYDLIAWRVQLLSEDVGDDAEDAADAANEAADLEGNAKAVGAQTIIHRLNALSRLYIDWRLAHAQSEDQVKNPVGKRVRPSKPTGRDRRLMDGEEERLQVAADAARSWLRYAIVLAIETALRQSELARLTWDRVTLDGDEPKIYMPRGQTKSRQQRTIPLSPQAIETLRELRDLVRPGELARWNGRVQKTEGAEFGWPEAKVLPVESGRGIIHAWREMLLTARAEDEDAFADLVWHDLRHEAVSRFFETSSLSETEIMSIVGHMSREMLARYTHHRTARLAAKLNSGRKSAKETHGSLRLPVAADPLVRTGGGDWVPLLTADAVYRNAAIVQLRAVLTMLEQHQDEPTSDDFGDEDDE